MKKILLLVLLVASQFCSAQQYKSMIYNSVGQNMAIRNIICIGDTTYYLSGTICPDNGKECSTIRAVDKSGNKIFEVFYDSLDLGASYSICTDGKYIYFNTILNYSSNPLYNVLMKLSRDCELIKKIEYKYADGKSHLARSINVIGDSLVVAYAYDTIDTDSTFFLFFDKNLNFGGIFKYTNTPPNSLHELSYHYYKTNDGNYITNREIFYYLGAFSKELIKFKPSGEVIWSKLFDKIDFLNIHGRVNGLVVMSDGSYVFNHYRVLDTTDGEINNRPFTLNKLASDGVNLLWQYTFVSKGSNLNNFLFKTKNEAIVGGGMHLAMFDPNPWNQELLGWTYKVSNDGELLWERHIVDLTHNPDASYFYSGVELDNGDLVLGGGLDTLYDPGNPKPVQNCWVVRLDSNGCLNAGCLDTIFITSAKSIYSAEDLDLVIYPNPSKDNITIQVPGYKEPEYIVITDVNGSPRMKRSFDTHMNISSLSSGIYQILFYWKDGKVATGRFIKVE